MDRFVELEQFDIIRLHYENEPVIVILYKSANYVLITVLNKENKLINVYKKQCAYSEKKS